MLLQLVMSPEHLAGALWAPWNVALFEAIRGTAASPGWLTATAIFLARRSLWGVIALTVWQLWRRRSIGGALLLLGAWFVSNRIEALISHLAWHPRPFDAGFGPALVLHAANNSMPSSHVTLGLILTGVLLALKCPRTALLAGVITLGLAWARIFVGIHWPIDMLAAIPCAGLSLVTAWAAGRLWNVLRRRVSRHGHPAPTS